MNIAMNIYYKLVMFQKKIEKLILIFLKSFFRLQGDCDDFHEKNLFNKETKRIANMVSELSDTIKGELWRELERQSLDD